MTLEVLVRVHFIAFVRSLIWKFSRRFLITSLIRHMYTCVLVFMRPNMTWLPILLVLQIRMRCASLANTYLPGIYRIQGIHSGRRGN